jgi:hypothetical protein
METDDDPGPDPEAPVHCVRVMCPEGFPVDDFWEFAKPIIREALASVHESGPRAWQVTSPHSNPHPTRHPHPYPHPH